jgi:hypothetical protein
VKRENTNDLDKEERKKKLGGPLKLILGSDKLFMLQG